MKNVIKYNRPLAFCVLVIVVALSLVVGCVRTLSSFENKVESLYESTKAMADINDLYGYASKIQAGAKAAGFDTAKLDEALEALAKNASDPTALGDTVSVIFSESSILYSDISYSGKVADMNSLTAYMAEIESTMMRLQNNTKYNKAALDYNRAIRSFPASIFALGRNNATVFG